MNGKQQTVPARALSWRRRAGFMVGGAVLALALAGCGGSPSPANSSAGAGDSTTTTPGAQVTPPLMVDVAQLDGTTQQLPMDKVLVLGGDTDPVTDWHATTDPEGIVTFTPGKDDGSATFNPSFSAVKEGTTTVRLTNTSSGVTSTFTIEVTAPQ